MKFGFAHIVYVKHDYYVNYDSIYSLFMLKSNKFNVCQGFGHFIVCTKHVHYFYILFWL